MQYICILYHFILIISIVILLCSLTFLFQNLSLILKKICILFDRESSSNNSVISAIVGVFRRNRRVVPITMSSRTSPGHLLN